MKTTTYQKCNICNEIIKAKSSEYFKYTLERHLAKHQNILDKMNYLNEEYYEKEQQLEKQYEGRSADYYFEELKETKELKSMFKENHTLNILKEMINGENLVGSSYYFSHMHSARIGMKHVNQRTVDSMERNGLIIRVKPEYAMHNNGKQYKITKKGRQYVKDARK